MAWPCIDLVELTGSASRDRRRRLDGRGLGGVVGARAGAVGVDVADVRAAAAGVARAPGCMARAAPSAEGSVMWPASLVAPKPRISPRMAAPRRSAFSSDSSTKHGRPFGEHEALAVGAERAAGRAPDARCRSASTRIDSQARMIPNVSGASAPPANTASAWPARIAWKARPIACALDAHAETTRVRRRPSRLNFVATALAAALYIDIGIDVGGMRGWFSP